MPTTAAHGLHPDSAPREGERVVNPEALARPFPERVKVVHVITTLGAGGAQQMLLKLVTAERGRGDVLRVIALAGDVDRVGAEIQALGIPVATLGLRKGSLSPGPVLDLIERLRSDGPDVVQTWMYHADLVGGLAAKVLHIPVVWGVRHDVLRRGDKVLTRVTRRLCARLSRWVPERIVFNSEASRRTHERLGYAAEKLLVIPNGFDLSRFRPDPAAREAVRAELGVASDAPLVGIVGRYHPHKDHATFLSAAARVRGRIGAARFLLCGAGIGWDNRELAAAIDRLELRPSTILLGSRDDVPRVVSALDVACLSSTTESFPNVVGEAMACAVPCVSTDCGDVRELLAEGGRVVPVGDAAAFAEAVLDLLGLAPAERVAAGGAGRERIRRLYDVAVAAQRFRDVHAQVARRRA